MMTGKERHRDRPVGLSLEAGIDGTEHLAKTLPALRSYARVWGRRWRVDGAPVSSDGLKPIRCHVVEKDERGARWPVV